MESFLPSEIARLVLGYLEDQKCEEAYNTFLKTSLHLEECLRMKEDGRKFRTQVLGLSLLDILYEYSAIYSLVQERLKKVDPEAVERLRHSGTLLDKITFLLNSTSSGQTMLFSISLPPGNSPQTSTVAHAHVRKRLRTSSSHDKRKDITRKNFKPNHNENSIIETSSNVHDFETTNLNSLPGNSNQNLTQTGQENDILRTPKRKMQGNNKRQSRANSVVPEELEENFDITALTQALLDNHELHEKIAENINKVICTPEINTNVSVGLDTCSAQNPTSDINTSVQNTNNFTMELDNVIKKIVHDTESDPIFENFLHEVVGPPGQEETSDDYDDKGISNTSTPSKSGPDTVKKQPLKNRTRSAKQKRTHSPENIADTIDDHNAVAIESIISINAPEGEKTCSVPTTEIIKNIENVATSTVSTTNTSAIVSENATIQLNPSVPVTLPLTPASNQNLTVDTSAPPTTNIDSNVLGNQNKNVLMLGQQPIQQQQQQQLQPTFVIADSFPSIYQQPTIMPDNRIIFLSNKTSAIGSQYLTMPQTFQISQPATVITDNDILNMPTVFISDDPKTSSGYIISQPTCSKRPKTIRKVCNKPKPRLSPRKIIQKNDNTVNNNLELSTTTTQETETIKYTISIQAEPKQTNTNEEPAPSTSVLEKETLPEKNVTPEKPKSTSSSKLQLSLSSPRSNKSHIRALDFSTPPKEDDSPRKANTSPKSLQKDKLNKIRKSPKAIRKLSTALFVSPVKSTKLPIATKSPKVKLKGDWNEDLILTNKKNDDDKNKKSKLHHSCSEKCSNCNKSSENNQDNHKVCDCVSKPVVKKITSWDHELRSLIVPIPSTSTTEPKKTPAKKRTRTSNRNKDKKDKKPNANTTENEVLSIEAELAKMEDSESEKQATDKDKEKETVAEESEPKLTKSQPEKKKKQNSKSKTIVQKVELNIREETTINTTPEKVKEAEKSEDGSNNTSNQDLNKSIPTESLRNMTPKIRKKCNTSNSSKKTPTNSDENKQKPPENETNSQTIEVKEMTILSPSKMDKNASKRTLVEQSVKDDSQTEKDFLAPSKELNKSLSSIITPNMLKATCSNSNELIAKRNLIPVLETPMKEDSSLLPITPRLFTPFNLDSPLTRILGEKMDTGDLVPFLSPSFPMTPSFPVTPNLQSGDTQSSYASRPTDYSNSSSYYQPSDSEQNQKLEQVLIDEAMKIETSDLKSKYLKTSTPCKTSDTAEATEVAPTNSATGVTAKARLSDNLLEQSNSSKKSLNTTHSSLDSSSTASSSNTSSSLSSDESKENIDKHEGNVTVIHAVPEKPTTTKQNEEKIPNQTPKRELCVKLIKTPELEKHIKKSATKKEPTKKLRGRPKLSVNNSNEKVNKTTTSTAQKKPPGRPRRTNAKQVKEEEEDDTIEKHREIKSNVTGSHVMLLKELEEKRRRTITGLNTTKPNRLKKKLVKDIIKNNTKGSLRVTRASANKIEKEEAKKTVAVKLKVMEPPFIPRKSKTPQKASIESVAAKLLNDKKCDDAKNESEPIAPNTEIVNQSFASPIYSIGSPNVSISTIGQDDGLISYTPDEEIPRLHISSDEENIQETLNELNTKQNKIDDSDLLVKELKERGIYLIPNKEKRTEQFVKEKQNEETSTLQTQNNEEKLKPVISPSIKEKPDKIEIMSDIHLDKSKVIDLSTIELSQGIVTDVISRVISKNTEPIQENIKTSEPIATNETAAPENIVTNKDVSKENTNNSDSTLDVSENSDYDFHVKVINEESPEYFNITYDETSKTQKNISDYNFTVLERNISAKIFIEELDKWEDKTFTVTPYINIYTASPKRKTKTDNTNTAKVIKTTDTNKNKKLAKPSEPISRKGDSNKSETKSKASLKPLDILYNECADESSTDTIITIKESEPKNKSSNSNENDKKEKHTTKDNTSSKSGVKKTISLEQYKINKNKENKTVQKTKDEINFENVEIIDASVDDDLMNFALTSTSKDSTNQELNTKKRKAAEENMKQNVEKRMKPNDKHALLKSIDVDSFLTKVHGPS